MVTANNKISGNKNPRQMLAISITMPMWQCNAGRIAQWSTSRALLEATGCRHRASACAALPRRPPWLTNYSKAQNTNEKLFLASSLTVVDRSRTKSRLIDAQAAERCETPAQLELKSSSYNISSYQTFSADKYWRGY